MNGDHVKPQASSSPSKQKPDASKKQPPPKPPTQTPAFVTKEVPSLAPNVANHPIKEEVKTEPKKPEWMEELSRNKAFRKSAFLREQQELKKEENDSHNIMSVNSTHSNTQVSNAPIAHAQEHPKPQIPVKPVQIKDEGKI